MFSNCLHDPAIKSVQTANKQQNNSNKVKQPVVKKVSNNSNKKNNINNSNNNKKSNVKNNNVQQHQQVESQPMNEADLLTKWAVGALKKLNQPGGIDCK